MAPRTRIDYDSIEPDWRAGIKSPDQLAAEYHQRTGDKATRQAIIKHFNKLNVPRDLTAKIQARADAIVAESIVANTVAPATKARIIEANASAQADIRTQQMLKATDGRHIVESMLNELKIQNASGEELSKLGELMADPDARSGKLSELYHKVISFGGRVDSVKKLIEAWAKTTDVERRAYGINDKPADIYSELPRDEVERRLAELEKRR